jgi:hypothetical protein
MRPAVPSGRLPDGAGKLPAPPIFRQALRVSGSHPTVCVGAGRRAGDPLALARPNESESVFGRTPLPGRALPELSPRPPLDHDSRSEPLSLGQPSCGGLGKPNQLSSGAALRRGATFRKAAGPTRLRTFDRGCVQPGNVKNAGAASGSANSTNKINLPGSSRPRVLYIPLGCWAISLALPI